MIVEAFHFRKERERERQRRKRRKEKKKIGKKSKLVITLQIGLSHILPEGKMSDCRLFNCEVLMHNQCESNLLGIGGDGECSGANIEILRSIVREYIFPPKKCALPLYIPYIKEVLLIIINISLKREIKQLTEIVIQK